MSYASTLAEHRRIAILKILLETGGQANESILKDALAELGLGAMLTRQAVRDDISFLETVGAVRLTWYEDKLVVPHITERGQDIAEGREIVAGIKRPSLAV
jgi:hypothetical protein